MISCNFRIFFMNSITWFDFLCFFCFSIFSRFFDNWLDFCDFSVTLIDLLKKHIKYKNATATTNINLNYIPLTQWFPHWFLPDSTHRDAPFHRIAYDYSRPDWGGLCDHLRDVPWEDIFKLGASAAASEFCEWVQVGIDIYIYHSKKISGQASLIPMVFNCLCCCHSS